MPSHFSTMGNSVTCSLQTIATCENLTGSNIADLLRTMVEDWVLADKDPALLTDNASNMAITVHSAEIGVCKMLCAQYKFWLPNVRSSNP